MEQLAEFWSRWLWPILQLVIGFGLVIFVHELGHFLVAKWAGIRIERFAIGFGPRVLGVRRGETDYCVNLLPLGGYVKMLGQEDFKPLEEGGRPDPRSYMAKSPGTRIAVVSAGVVMNVIFAALLFVIVGLAGIRFPAPVIGNVAENYPASSAEITWLTPSEPAGEAPAASAPVSAPAAVSIGLEPGDRVLQINGRDVTQFSDLMVEALLADPGEIFELKIERTQGRTKRIGMAEVGIRQLPPPNEDRRGFGLAPASDTTFAEIRGAKLLDPFRKGDKVVAIDGKPIEGFLDIREVTDELNGQPVVVTVLRSNGGSESRLDFKIQPILYGGNLEYSLVHEGQVTHGTIIDQSDDAYTLVQDDGQQHIVPVRDATVQADELLGVLGMSPRLMVEAVADDSPAGKAGIQPGDIIVDYGDQGPPSLRRLRDISDRQAEKGTTIVVTRDGKTLSPIPIKPRKSGARQAQLGITLAPDVMHPAIASVRGGSPAYLAGIRPGDELRKVNGKPVATWIDLFNSLREAADAPVTVTVARGVQELDAPIGALHDPGEARWLAEAGTALLPRPARLLVDVLRDSLMDRADYFDPGDYSFQLFSPQRQFNPLMGPETRKTNPFEAVAWGTRQTGRFLLMTYDSLRRLMGGTVSPKELRGPVGIGDIAIDVGRKGVVDFMYLMAIISISLAVVNFLPIPVVDGGHVMFLIIEKIRGKPVPVRILNYAQIIGLVLLVAVFVAVTWQDIARLLTGR